MGKTRDRCSPEEIVAYTDAYFAAVDLVNEALFKFDLLARLADNAEDRSFFRAKSLEAQRDVELLKNQRRAFNVGDGAINPPSMNEVDAAQRRTAALSAVQADEAHAKTILALFDEGLKAFNAIAAA